MKVENLSFSKVTVPQYLVSLAARVAEAQRQSGAVVPCEISAAHQR